MPPFSVILEGPGERELETLAGRVPDAWMSTVARKFAIALMKSNLAQLRSILE